MLDKQAGSCNSAFWGGSERRRALFIVCFHYTDEIKLCLACLRVSHAGTCVQILRQTANFGEIFARCARLQILNQIFENPCLGQSIVRGSCRAAYSGSLDDVYGARVLGVITVGLVIGGWWRVLMSCSVPSPCCHPCSVPSPRCHPLPLYPGLCSTETGVQRQRDGDGRCRSAERALGACGSVIRVGYPKGGRGLD